MMNMMMMMIISMTINIVGNIDYFVCFLCLGLMPEEENNQSLSYSEMI